jgi:hypothetical protein
VTVVVLLVALQSWPILRHTEAGYDRCQHLGALLHSQSSYFLLIYSLSLGFNDSVAIAMTIDQSTIRYCRVLSIAELDMSFAEYCPNSDLWR